MRAPKLPIAWVHVPKTGTSFLNTLLLTTSVCRPPIHAFHEGTHQHGFWHHRMNLSRCSFTSAARTQFSKGSRWSQSFGSPPGHTGFGPFADSLRGHGVTVLRQPEQRLISGWHHRFHSYPHKSRHPTLLTYVEHRDSNRRQAMPPHGKAVVK